MHIYIHNITHMQIFTNTSPSTPVETAPDPQKISPLGASLALTMVCAGTWGRGLWSGFRERRDGQKP